MFNYKKYIAEKIAKSNDLDINEIEGYIEIPPDKNMGDYAFPCFKLAKVLKKAPPVIAQELKEKIEIDEYIDRIEIAGGYLNFYVNKMKMVQIVASEYSEKGEEYGKSDIGNGKNVIVEYSSPNIAKPFHIGHLRTTVIGACLARVYDFLGYNVTRINHLGDYGTQFGKMIEGYKRWGNEYDLETNSIEKLMDIYVRINDLCKEDESVLEQCRENFRLLEEKEPYCTELWNRFKDLSLAEFQKIYDILDVHFDSMNGEAFYSDKIDEVVDILEKSGKLVESEGAQIIDLEDKGLGVCIIKKSNGSSIYATRDLAAVLYKARTYDFDKCLYIVAYEQNLHFKQVFEVSKLLGIPDKCVNGLEHVAYGMTRLPSGKMSTREGTVVKVEDLLQESIDRVKEIINEKNPEMENKDEEATKIGIGAVIFNNLCSTLIKDQVFDWNTVLNFNGESGPYIQYIYVRTKSVIEKAGYIPDINDVNLEKLQDKESLEVISNLYDFEDTLVNVVNKNETSFLTRYLINLAQSYSNFYSEHKIIDENKEVQDARIFLTKMTQDVLKKGAELLGIKMPNKM